MTPVVALLRGINVGGRARVAMSDLRRIASGIGLGGATTHLQSGNLVAVAEGDERSVAERLRGALGSELGLDIAVVVRSADRVAAVARAHPLASAVPDARLLHVVFLAEEPSAEAIAVLDPDRSPPDRFVVDGDHIYTAYPGGSGRSKLDLGYFERVLGVGGTARNWNTVTRLAAMAAGMR